MTPEAAFSVGLLPRVRQLAAIRRAQRAPGHARRHGQRDRRRLPGSGQHLRDAQSAHHRLGRPADHVERLDRVVARFDVAVDLERCGGQSGRVGSIAARRRPRCRVSPARRSAVRTPSTSAAPPRPSCASWCPINGSTCSQRHASRRRRSRPASTCSRCSPPKPRWPTGRTALDLGTSLGITGVYRCQVDTHADSDPPGRLRRPSDATGVHGPGEHRPQADASSASARRHPPVGCAGHGDAQGLTCAYNSMSSTTIQPTTTAVTATSRRGHQRRHADGRRGHQPRTRVRFGYGPSVVPPSATHGRKRHQPATRPAATTPAPRLHRADRRQSKPRCTRCSPRCCKACSGRSSRRPVCPWAGAQVADLSTNCGAVSLVQ